MNTIAEIEAEMRKLGNKKAKIEAAERQAIGKDLVGTCYKSSNSYGISDNCRRWPRYLKVTGCKHGYLTAVVFEKCTQGQVTFKREDYYSISMIDERERITPEAWAKAADKILGDAKKLLNA